MNILKILTDASKIKTLTADTLVVRGDKGNVLPSRPK